jgi:hypothetical protein
MVLTANQENMLRKRGMLNQVRLREYVVDLTKIDGHGDFPCPHCEATISPEDESDKSYTILKTKTKGDQLDELIIQCRKCMSKIRITGFLVLNAEEI